MTKAEEVHIDRVNYLTLALESSFREINLFHQRLNILVVFPMDLILPQDDWNLAHEVINPTRWDKIPMEPPINIFYEVLVAAAPLPQEDIGDDLFIFLLRDKEEMLNDL
ncbi:hypothetical protein Hanom_Chr01g00054421 [Helianthus anomalus]